MVTRRTVVGVAAVLALTLGGCRHMAVQQRQQEIAARMNPLVGATEDQVVLALGPPARTQTVGGLMVHTFYWNYGTRGAAVVVPGQYVTTGVHRSHEVSDTINTYFRDGHMVKWDSYVQR